MIGARTTALRRLVYQDSRRALPLTTFRLCFITTEWRAVITELATPNEMPVIETTVPSRNTPMKKPTVTTEQARIMNNEGLVWRKTYEVVTVKGSKSPRATW